MEIYKEMRIMEIRMRTTIKDCANSQKVVMDPELMQQKMIKNYYKVSDKLYIKHGVTKAQIRQAFDGHKLIDDPKMKEFHNSLE
eukprot:CAMPEP_0176341196 /NCGR_PEP_ID=MMETSP0126-20121128/2174_1 /TAXON_ID=141414 ORGANISM="Strombidinopsis acuminatum, Strain SPMC142" /NCGR_SAMPLE_ID=MMETSP0126 /ASSEMBLY_ACC=CAM_ASM_000229 /LENGTH=83 /DNA_ID=CAMNT_0017685847 /DNA_START=304 /DNA_END=555 /DNA_ORIENTATION=-